MKKLSTAALFLMLTGTAFAQEGRVGINTETPKTTFDVNGKKDGSGNQDLSNRRAQKLYDVIIASGIEPSRVTIKGEGVDASYPNTKTGLDLARRVSITIQ